MLDSSCINLWPLCDIIHTTLATDIIKVFIFGMKGSKGGVRVWHRGTTKREAKFFTKDGIAIKRRAALLWQKRPDGCAQLAGGRKIGYHYA